jgi:hypothetical protein
MKAITDHSFEGVNGAGNNMSRFMRVNLDRIRAKTASAMLAGSDYNTLKAYTPLKTPLAVPDEWIVSQGSLPQLEDVSISAGNDAYIITGIPTTEASVTYQQVCDALGLQRGDQITFVCWRGPAASGAVITNLLRSRFDYFRIILDPVSPEGEPEEMSTPFLTAGGAIASPNPRNSSTWSHTFSTESGDIYVTFSGQLLIQSAALIASRKNSDGTYSYSPAQMSVFSDTGSLYNLATLEWALLQSKPQTATENAMYLRQAQDN